MHPSFITAFYPKDIYTSHPGLRQVGPSSMSCSANCLLRIPNCRFIVISAQVRTKQMVQLFSFCISTMTCHQGVNALGWKQKQYRQNQRLLDTELSGFWLQHYDSVQTFKPSQSSQKLYIIKKSSAFQVIKIKYVF